MTREDREDAIDIIQSVLNKYEEDECLVTEITIGDEDIKAFKMAIKALEQEPVIDKIRAEIAQMDFDFGDFYDHTGTITEMVLEVIDKYKAESEDKE